MCIYIYIHIYIYISLYIHHIYAAQNNNIRETQPTCLNETWCTTTKWVLVQSSLTQFGRSLVNWGSHHALWEHVFLCPEHATTNFRKLSQRNPLKQLHYAVKWQPHKDYQILQYIENGCCSDKEATITVGYNLQIPSSTCYMYARVGYNPCVDCRSCNSWYSSSSQKMGYWKSSCPKNITCRCFQISTDIRAFVWKCAETRLVVDLTAKPGHKLSEDQRDNSRIKLLLNKM